MATLEFTVPPLKMPLYGVKGVEIYIDGEPKATVTFGETATLDLPAGSVRVQTLLHGPLKRASKELPVTLREGEATAVVAKYSRLSGNFKLRVS